MSRWTVGEAHVGARLRAVTIDRPIHRQSGAVSDGNVYDKATGKYVGQLSKKGNIRWRAFLKRLGLLGTALSLFDIATGQQDVEAAVLDSLMISDAGPSGTFWPEDGVYREPGSNQPCE